MMDKEELTGIIITFITMIILFFTILEDVPFWCNGISILLIIAYIYNLRDNERK